MKKLSGITAILLALSLQTAHAQNLAELVHKDREASDNIYHPYFAAKGELTPAPDGFRPFYISHYGRHGSRYLTGDYYFTGVREGLEKADSAGLLTYKGKKLMEEFTKYVDEHKGVYGQLSPRGAREHRAIAARMFERFPSVFTNPYKTDIACVSSTVPRCLVSMANFTTALNDCNPALDFSFTTGDKYLELLSKGYDDERVSEGVRHMSDSLRKATLHYEKTFAVLFTDPAKAAELIGTPERFLNQVFSSGTACQCLDYLGVDLLKYFDIDELAALAVIRNNVVYGDLGNSLEYGDITAAPSAALVRDIVEKADEAIEYGSEKAADLRFGHDGGFVSLLSMIGTEGNYERYPLAEASEHWFSYRMVCMAANLQFIFYRNREGEVLVKILHNEAETSVREVPAFQGPYYRWTDLRSYLLRRASQFSAQ